MPLSNTLQGEEIQLLIDLDSPFGCFFKREMLSKNNPESDTVSALRERDMRKGRVDCSITSLHSLPYILATLLTFPTVKQGIQGQK